ncbi:TetR/AcrR family transcriptional regulator [bacterium]|nr:TetR/AcrR family transcriptional regulator [bacterium]
MTKQKIIESSFQLFAHYGIKAITMDDIARHLGISKKTLYANFLDKDELVLGAIKWQISTITEAMLEIQTQSIDAIDELVKSSEFMSKMLKGMNPTALMDMRKFHPAAWEAFEEHQKGFFMKIVQANLKRGIEQGLYRSNIDMQIVSLKRMYEVEMCMSPERFPITQFNIDYVQVQVMDLFMHGIATLKGHKLINKYKKIKEDE